MVGNQVVAIGLLSLVSVFLLTFVFHQCRQYKSKCKLVLQTFLIRHQAAQSYPAIIKAGIGGVITIAIVSLMSNLTDSILLMASFGASCVLLFSVPQSPLSQPINVIAGHVVSSLFGLGLHQFLSPEWWVLGLAVGLAIAIMALLRITHPPAGADPLVIFFTDPGWWYIIFPVLLGSIALVIIAWLFHKLPVKTVYPLPIKVDTKN